MEEKEKVLLGNLIWLVLINLILCYGKDIALKMSQYRGSQGDSTWHKCGCLIRWDMQNSQKTLPDYVLFFLSLYRMKKCALAPQKCSCNSAETKIEAFTIFLFPPVNLLKSFTLCGILQKNCTSKTKHVINQIQRLIIIERKETMRWFRQGKRYLFLVNVWWASVSQWGRDGEGVLQKTGAPEEKFVT